MKHYLTKATKWLGYSIAFFLVIVATLVSVGRLMTPYLNQHLPDFEVWASELLNTPVKIQQVYISWDVYIPELTMKKVKIIDKETKTTTFEINEININFKLFDSLITRKPIPSYINISGVDVTIRAGQSGKVMIAGWGPFSVSDNLTGASEEGSTIAYWIFSQPALVLDHIHVKFIPENGEAKSVNVHKLSLYNSKRSHTLKGRATLNQEIPTSIAFNLAWKGDLQDVANISAHSYAYIEAISLPQWLKNKTWQHLQIQEGLGSAKIWMDWDHGQLQKVQTQFQFYELKLHSLITQQTQRVTRLNGHVGFKREGDQQVFAGRDILIDLPEHLWPMTSFSISVPNDTTNKTYEAKIEYLDLADSYDFLLASGLLPENVQQLLLTLKPKGELSDLHAKFSDHDHLENNSVSLKFLNASLNAYQTFPAMHNLTGSLDWNEDRGNFAIHSKKINILYDALFAAPIAFDKIDGTFKLYKKNNEWTVSTKDFSAENQELNIKGKMTVTKAEAASPLLDLALNFSMPNVVYLPKYMPIKILEPELSRWLKQAFLEGELHSGKAIIQGNLSDYPFVNNNGKFLVEASGKDLNFSYAPEWPSITHLNGDIIFAGDKMQVQVESGQMLNIPLKNIVATIPYLGPKQPQVVEVKGDIQGDLQQGLQFIQQSPLKKTIGKNLNNFVMTGPLQLNLALVIPVRKPENAKVEGVLQLSNASLHLADWQVGLEDLQGKLQFTEKSMEATHLQGNFLGEPAQIQVTTEFPENKPSFINFKLESKVTENLLKTYLKGNMLEPYVKGNTNYQAELHLISEEGRQPIELFITSNLQGMTLDFPEGFGKKELEILPTTFVANIEENKPLRMKLKLGNQLSLASTIKKTNKGFEFYSGEMRIFNNGEANWQTQPGLLISGQFETLDWNKLQSYISDSSSNQSSSYLSMLRGLDVRAKKVTGLAQAITNVRAQIQKSSANWTIQLNATEMAGKVTLPMDFSSRKTVHADFQYLYLSPTDNAGETLNPKKLPGISFTGNEVRYKGQNLGHIEFELVPISNGLKLASLRADSPLYNLKATGEWSNTDNQSQTYLNGVLTTKNVANFLNHWGSSSPNPVGSKGSMKFDLSWPEAPYHPILAKMTGEASLDVTAGHIIHLDQSTNAKMGFGRMLNILSIQSLSRVLTFNFSDLTAEGYSFDFIKGNFTLKNGSIHTDNTLMDGSLADIAIKGRIGLVAKDYDLVLNITPQVTGSIPVVAAIAVNPLIGVAAWAVEKVASGAVSSAATKHYSITGTWDKPVWRERK